MLKFSSYFLKSFIVSALLLIVTLISISFFGVYFLGDTVTYMQFGSMGSPLTTFIQHDSLWPPLFALIYNVASHMPVSPFVLASLWVSGTLIVFLGITTLFISLLDLSKFRALAVAALLITGPVTLLMQSYISEPLTLVLWMSTLYATIQFWKTSKEQWLILWLVVASLLPISRWLGALLTVWFSGWIFVKLIFDLRKNKKTPYSPWFVLLSLATVWVPTGLYLFRTKVMIGSFFPLRDAQLLDASQIVLGYGKEIFSGAGLSSLAAFLYALGTKTKAKMNSLWIVFIFTLGSAMIYLAGLLFSESHYFIVPHIPSRFVGLSFPFIVLSAFVVGILAQRFISKKMQPWALGAGALLGTILIVSALITSIFQLHAEELSAEPLHMYVGWTGDLAEYCRPNTTLIYHIHTRNWGAHAYDYLCETATVVTTPTETVVQEGTTVISPYKIENLKLTNTFTLNEYITYVYTATQSATIHVEDLFANRTLFE